MSTHIRMRSLQSSVVWSLFCIYAALPGFSIRGVIIKRKTIIKTGYNCIQNFRFFWGGGGGGGGIVGYMVRNLVLHQRVSAAKKRDFRMYIRRYTSTNENFL